MIIEVKPNWTGRVFKFKISDVDFGYNKPVYLWNEEKGEWKEVSGGSERNPTKGILIPLSDLFKKQNILPDKFMTEDNK